MVSESVFLQAVDVVILTAMLGIVLCLWKRHSAALSSAHCEHRAFHCPCAPTCVSCLLCACRAASAGRPAFPSAALASTLTGSDLRNP